MTPPLWVIGAGGLLGSAVRRRMHRAGLPGFTAPADWTSTPAAIASLEEGVRRYVGVLDGGAPVILWCAGAGVPHSPQAALDQEHEEYAGFLAALERLVPGGQLEHATLFFTSSAGAVYAGVEAPPYREASPVRPLAPYGHHKLRLEDATRAFASRTGARAAIGRISNLYGTGQNLAKAQGLVSVLLHSALTHAPVSIYVSLDTVRDYVYTDDAARLVLDVTRRAATELPGTTAMKILASGRRTTIATLLGVTRAVVGRRPLIIQGASPYARVQARDLSMESRVWTDLDAPVVPLEDGMNRVYEDLTLRHAAATI